MNYRINLLLLVTAIVALSWSAAPAVAGNGCGCGHGLGYGQYSLYVQERIPYFAQNPPVYYSYPVPRTYGHSPYAYPAWFKTPEAATPTPITLDNPYVPQRANATETTNRSAAITSQPPPLVIMNPYVKQARVIADAAK